MKTVKVNDKEVQIKDWNEFWQLVETSNEKIELISEDDPYVNIYVDDVRFSFHAKSNWYNVNILAKAKLSDSRILSVIENTRDYWDYITIRNVKRIYEIELKYQSRYFGEPMSEIYFVTTIWKRELHELLQPVDKIYRDIKRFFKNW
jgi:hypothetical protein